MWVVQRVLWAASMSCNWGVWLLMLWFPLLFFSFSLDLSLSRNAFPVWLLRYKCGYWHWELRGLGVKVQWDSSHYNGIHWVISSPVCLEIWISTVRPYWLSLWVPDFKIGNSKTSRVCLLTVCIKWIIGSREMASLWHCYCFMVLLQLHGIEKADFDVLYMSDSIVVENEWCMTCISTCATSLWLCIQPLFCWCKVCFLPCCMRIMGINSGR